MAGFFGLFDYNKPGPGVRKDEAEKKGAAKYFDILGRRIWKLVTVNFLYLLFSIIPYLIMWFICNNIMIVVMMICGVDTSGIKAIMDEYGTLLTILGVLVMYTLNGGGAASCGLDNVIRKYIDDTHAWVWQDFWGAFKSNFLQGTVAFAIDCLAVAVLTFSFGIYYFPNKFVQSIIGSGILLKLIQTLLLFVALMWGMMHIYIYPVITSFKFKLRDVYKNSFIMVLGKLPQTAAAFVLGILIALIVAALTVIMPLFGLLIGIILFAMVDYTKLFITYPLIKKYMRDPEEAKREERLNSLRRDIEADDKVFSDKQVKNK